MISTRAPIEADSQQDRHVHASRYKTKMCRNYLVSGECPYEFRCMFAHGDHELRTMEMNLKDGLITEEAIKLFNRSLKSTSYVSTPPSMSPSKSQFYASTPTTVRRFVHNPYSLSCSYAYVLDDVDACTVSATSPPSYESGEGKGGALVLAP